MRTFLVSLYLCVLTGAVFAQSDGMASIASTYDGFRVKGIHEKLFVHTDKPAYLAGEICWFKLYCLDASTHRPLDISKVAYVELLDKDDRFVLQGKISMEHAEGEGSFFLPLTINSGNYKLRAYTNWMKNFGPDQFFEETLTIINTLKAPIVPASPDQSKAGPVGIAFYPEGGDLVNGIPSTVAFQGMDDQGRSRSCRGVVVDEHSDTVCSFATTRFGIGKFSFMPVAGHRYRAVVRFEGSDGPAPSAITRDLPAALDQGYAVHVGSDGSRITVAVHAKGAGGSAIYLLGHRNGSRPFVRRADLVQEAAKFVLDRDSLDSGITELTLFDASLHPVCERLVFKRPIPPVAVGIQTDQDRYARRKKVALSLLLPDASPASLSMAVYRSDMLEQARVADIHSWLWLVSDLKGHIDSLEQYFSLPDDEASSAFDGLMLTHGWRRLHWDAIRRIASGQTVLPNPPEYSGHLITGKLTDARTGEPQVNRFTSLTVPGVYYKFQSARSDSNGRIFFDIRDYFGSTGIVIHSGTRADSPCKVEIFSPFSEQFAGDRLPPFGLSEEMADDLTRRSLDMQIQNIYAGDSIQRFFAPMTDTFHFYGEPYRSYMLDDYTRFTTMEEVLREYVQEIGVNRPRGKLHVLMEDILRREFFDDDNTLVLLDGVPVPDDRIFDYDPLKVRRLEVIPMRYFLGPSAFSGVASFTTYNGNYEGYELDRHQLFVDYEGFQFKREFYSPLYATPEQSDSHIPDLRELMYWAPEIHAAGKSKSSLDFYTSDLPGKYRVVVQGITAAGRACSAETEFEVR